MFNISKRKKRKSDVQSEFPNIKSLLSAYELNSAAIKHIDADLYTQLKNAEERLTELKFSP